MKTTRTKKNQFFSWIGFVALLALIPVLWVGCTKNETALKTLTVKILNTDELIREDAFSPIVQQFAASHPGWVVSCVPVTVSADAPVDEWVSQLTQCDVAVFPSILHEKLHSQSNLFYPVQAMEISLPSVLDAAYAGTTKSTFWAVPLLLDPMMMVVKKSGPDDTNVTAEWQTILMRSRMLEKPQPYFVFLSGTPYGLADGIALQQFAAGYLTEILHNTPPVEGITEADKLGDLARSLASMKPFIADTQDDRLLGIHFVKTLEDFLESDAIVTFARYSEWAQLSEPQRNRLFETPIPCANGPVSIGHVIAAGIPVQSKDPAMGEELIRLLVDQVEQIALKQSNLVAQIPSDNEKGMGIFARDTVFVPRKNNGALGEKVVIDAINGELGIDEFNRLWGTFFFIPSANF